MSKIENTKYYSKCVGNLCRGCNMCVQGKKLVMFVTGICGQDCYYCPLSTEKKNKDKVWANERPILEDSELLAECNSMRARGCGITGGDPLSKLDRTIHYIELLKKEYGQHFHIHLYTPLLLLTHKTMVKLYKAGLDEIRFHPEFDKPNEWVKIEQAIDFGWDVGVEIPVVPGKEKEIKQMIDYLDGKIKFLNLNELEISETNSAELGRRDLAVKDDVSYGISGSEELAIRLLKYCSDKKLIVHYCTSKLKDKVQLSNRIKRTAKTVKRKFDIVTPEGTLVRGAIYLRELRPGAGYRKKIQEANKEEILKKLKILKEKIQKKYNIRDDMLEIDSLKLRIITGPRLVKIFKQYTRAIVEEYPTYDQMEVELRFLPVKIE